MMVMFISQQAWNWTNPYLIEEAIQAILKNNFELWLFLHLSIIREWEISSTQRYKNLILKMAIHF